MNKQCLGSDLEDFLSEEGCLEQARTEAAKYAFIAELRELMRQQTVTQGRLAELMGTSRSQVGRLLDPTNRSFTLTAAARAASALGKTVKLTIV